MYAVLQSLESEAAAYRAAVWGVLIGLQSILNNNLTLYKCFIYYCFCTDCVSFKRN